ncbi:bifunctional glycosyltransferase family 2 protein/CDP-glycerol:glycerophosphate glycerophosphotransferase [Plantactinospora sp. KBS50]|uniref:bifunctional glycosyltransferase/CDP-glycerol:glycerophosphate glycerophosphotransferase n=1 Tax=Plantactinospora sp. KBS50 TaxID=2024580 RepID=UPI000BAAD1E8|nr:bifunctional glycosyltransferase family 2 protein/CDP-glycerol:glycerophosphate glycerophosphotransferase [Plantactinospora sp. KBS50]ASW53346.1 CDP-glycerol--glycerophosphate glycerophosphotransferase [Plantactinospora sp. KBS50]
MTLISFVVPVYQVQGYLRECLDSILDQSFTDVEVIAIDDNSPDHSGEILAEYAARDPRLRVVSLDRNEGQGPARNRGAKLATGKYVWFLDSDDWLAEGAIQAVVDRLRETDAEVLIVDWARVYWTGRTDNSVPGRRFNLAPAVFAAREWPEVLEILHVPWNKVIRRDLLERIDFQFRSGWYEDVPFTYRLLLTADRVSLLARTCVYYRRRRSGAATGTLGDGHFAIFPNWAQVFETFDDSRPGAADLRGRLFRRMIWHFLMVRGNDDRMPKHLRKRYFAEMTDHYRRYLPPDGYPMPDGVEGLKHRLVARGAHHTFQALRLAFRARAYVSRKVRKQKRRVGKTARQVAKVARDGLLMAYYKLQLRMPMDPKLALYGAYWYRGYSCNPAAIYAKARDLAPDVHGVFVVRRDKAETMPPGVDYVIAGTARYYRMLARAHWLINNVNWPDMAVKRPGSVHVMTHHGTPLKVMGIDQRSYPAGAGDPDLGAQLRRADRWDYSITANGFTSQMWDRAYPCRYETLETGYPRNDRLALATPEEIARVRASLGIAPTDRVVLYAPTHREHLPGYHPPFDAAAFVDAIGPNGLLLMRSHYFHDRAKAPVTRQEIERVRDVSEYPSVEDLYLVADVLVTDYSSLMFDYSVLDRPIVIYAPDWQAYRLVRGVYFDIMAEPPGAVATSFPDLLALFRASAVDDDAATKARSHFRARFSSLEDGHAAERVVQRVFLGRAG